MKLPQPPPGKYRYAGGERGQSTREGAPSVQPPPFAVKRLSAWLTRREGWSALTAGQRTGAGGREGSFRPYGSASQRTREGARLAAVHHPPTRGGRSALTVTEGIFIEQSRSGYLYDGIISLDVLMSTLSLKHASTVVSWPTLAFGQDLTCNLQKKTFTFQTLTSFLFSLLTDCSFSTEQDNFSHQVNMIFHKYYIQYLFAHFSIFYIIDFRSQRV